MRRIGFAPSLCAALISVNAVLGACGDKFLVPGRCLTFGDAYAAIYPSTVLIDATPRVGGSAAIRQPKFQSTLKQAGHQVSHLENHAQVVEALKSGKVDLVLADVDDAVALSRAAAGAASKATVLPVMMDKPNKAATDACRAEFGDRCSLRASDKPERFLKAIDDAMKARAKAQPSPKR